MRRTIDKPSPKGGGHDRHRGRKRNGRRVRVVDVLVEDVLSASDEEILATRRDAWRPGEELRPKCQLFQKSILKANKDRLRVAKAGLVASFMRVRAPSKIVTLKNVRDRLRRVLASCPPDVRLTLAARNENELSDADVSWNASGPRRNLASSRLMMKVAVNRDATKTNASRAVIPPRIGCCRPEEIDLEAIAFHLGASVRFRKLDGCEARIIGCNDAGIITISNCSLQAPHTLARNRRLLFMCLWFRLSCLLP